MPTVKQTEQAGMEIAIDNQKKQSGDEEDVMATPHVLSPQQEQLWFLYKLHSGDAAYNLSAAWQCRGPLNVEALRWSLRAVVHRHEVLRSTVRDVDGVPFQFIEEGSDTPIRMYESHSS